MAMIIALASGKGGVGKTALTAALSLALCKKSKQVLAVDADMGLRNLDLMFGVQDEVFYDLGDILKQRCRVKDAIISIEPGLDFLAASQKHTWEKIDAATFQFWVDKLSKKYDYVLIDSPPGRGYAYREATAIADQIFFIVAPTWTSLRDAARVTQYCRKHKKFNYSVILNNFSRISGYTLSVSDALDSLQLESLAGILPHDKVVEKALYEGSIDILLDSAFWRALQQTVRFIAEGKDIAEEEIREWLVTDDETALGQEAYSSVSPVARKSPRYADFHSSITRRRMQSQGWRRYRR